MTPPGRADTPQAKRRRNAAAGAPPARLRGANGQFVRTQTRAPSGPTYGRRVPAGEVTMVVASAAQIDLNDKRSLATTRRRRQAWQSEAWDYVSEVGELAYSFSYMGNLLSKLRLFAATRPDPSEAPIPVDDPDSGIDPSTAALAMDCLERLRAPEGGQSALVRTFAINFDVAGECYLHGHSVDEATGEEEWHIRSVDELEIKGDSFALRMGPGNKDTEPIPPDDIVIRLWERDARYGQLATSPMRRVLAEVESLLLLSRQIRAEAKARLSNGVLLIPSELSHGPADPTRDSGDGEATDDPFDKQLADSMITPIQDEGSASSVIPVILRGQASYIEKVRHLTLDRPIDAVLDQRIEGRVIRIARGLNLPVEMVTGMMATTFANANVIRQSVFDDHVQPRAVLMVDAWTAGYFQPALVEGGLDPVKARDIFIWFDASDLVARPDQADQAEKAHQDGIISDQARRRYLGFTESDAPEDSEVLRRILLKATRLDPGVEAQLLRRTGLFPEVMIPAPLSGVMVEEGEAAPIIVGGPNATAKASEIGGPADELPAAPPAPVHVMPPTGNPPPAEAPAPPAPAGVAASAWQDAWAEVMAIANRYGVFSDGAPPPVPVTASGAWAGLGARLATIDARLRDRVQLSLDQAMRRCLERAGARIRTKTSRAKGGDATVLARSIDGVFDNLVASTLGRSIVTAAGMTDAELIAGAFGPTIADCLEWMSAAQLSARQAIQAVTGPLPAATVDRLEASNADGLAAAGRWLGAILPQMATKRLYDPVDSSGAAGGEQDPTVTVSMSVARAAVGLAGGAVPKGGLIPVSSTLTAAGSTWVDVGPLESDGGGPMGGPGTGPDLTAVLSDVGAEVDGFVWDYGDADRKTFEPHADLDGVTFENFDDDVLLNETGWPDVDYYMPGDHDGCCCDVIPVVIGPSESGDALSSVKVDPGVTLDDSEPTLDDSEGEPG